MAATSPAIKAAPACFSQEVARGGARLVFNETRGDQRQNRDDKQNAGNAPRKKQIARTGRGSDMDWRCAPARGGRASRSGAAGLSIGGHPPSEKTQFH